MSCAFQMAATLVTGACLAYTARAVAAEPTPSDVDARYAAIESAMARGEAPARLWWNGWVTGYAALTVGEGALALAVKDKGLRVDAAVGAVTSALALGGSLLGPRTAFTARGKLEAMNASTPRARLARLHRAEQLLREAAEGERFGRSPIVQLSGAIVTLGGTWVLWLGYKRYTSGWLNLLSSLAVGELQILTQPTAAIEAWDEYRAGRLRARPVAPPSWTIVPTPGGVLLRGVF